MAEQFEMEEACLNVLRGNSNPEGRDPVRKLKWDNDDFVRDPFVINVDNLKDYDESLQKYAGTRPYNRFRCSWSALIGDYETSDDVKKYTLQTQIDWPSGVERCYRNKGFENSVLESNIKREMGRADDGNFYRDHISFTEIGSTILTLNGLTPAAIENSIVLANKQADVFSPNDAPLFKNIERYMLLDDESRQAYIKFLVGIRGVGVGHPVKSDDGDVYTLVSKTIIQVGRFIGEYTGEFTTDIGKSAYAHGIHPNFGSKLFRKRVEKWSIDASRCGNEMRFINANSGYMRKDGGPAFPNVAFFQYWYFGQPHIGVMAISNIPKNAEIIVSYGEDYWYGQLIDRTELLKENIDRLLLEQDQLNVTLETEKNKRIALEEKLKLSPTTEKLRCSRECEKEKWEMKYLISMQNWEIRDNEKQLTKRDNENKELIKQLKELQTRLRNAEAKASSERDKSNSYLNSIQILKKDNEELNFRLNEVQNAMQTETPSEEQQRIFDEKEREIDELKQLLHNVQELYRQKIEDTKKSSETIDRLLVAINDLRLVKDENESLNKTIAELKKSVISKDRKIAKNVESLKNIENNFDFYRESTENIISTLQSRVDYFSAITPDKYVEDITKSYEDEIKKKTEEIKECEKKLESVEQKCFEKYQSELTRFADVADSVLSQLRVELLGLSVTVMESDDPMIIGRMVSFSDELIKFSNDVNSKLESMKKFEIEIAE